ncbi:hypothetical protein TrLO_g4940 [Triparma laevis f. longispina]|uniref:Uncharacterized protein n=1 Tax=Triparma laevis f. longispina TaxID=1714387 RepID=A0A9W7C970_9STRA|nr:hypothetical protein TrLO_g4940 [Triparma laevis f. longispina]
MKFGHGRLLLLQKAKKKPNIELNTNHGGTKSPIAIDTASPIPSKISKLNEKISRNEKNSLRLSGNATSITRTIPKVCTQVMPILSFSSSIPTTPPDMIFPKTSAFTPSIASPFAPTAFLATPSA